MRRLFLYAIGGTGARVVRSLTMMLASGIDGLDSSTEIVPIILDYDLSNGDKTRAIHALETYSDIHSSLYPDTSQGVLYNDHFFMTKLTPLSQVGIADPGANLKDFEFNFGAAGTSVKYCDYLRMNALNAIPNLRATESLLYSLYDDSDDTDKNAELNLDMNKGFKGNPNIGSVVFHDLRATPEFTQFESTFNPINDSVFIISSIFGGTGASGFPEIVNAIRNSHVGNVRTAKIGTALILPYFDLQPFQPANGDTGAIDATSFNAKTKAALSYYAIPNGINSKVNAIYYVGDENHDSYQYNEGEDRQKNEAHVVEFVAATAVIDFLRRNLPNGSAALEFGIKDDQVNSSIQLPDFHDSTHKLVLDNLSSFAIAMKYYRDVICGDRNKVGSNVAYYNRFDLGTRLGQDAYGQIDEFLLNNSIQEAKDKWGFYRWLNELENHTHKLRPYVLDPGKDLTAILSHKTIASTGFLGMGGNPMNDNKISSELNQRTTNCPNYTAQTLFKVLRDISVNKYRTIR